MKKLISFSVLILSLLMTVPSCKKKDVNPDNNNNNGNNQNANVAISDLLNYYFVYVNSDGNIRVVYFFMDNGNFSGLRDGLGSRRGITQAAVSNNTFTCTADAVSYSFVLKKDATGSISLVSYTSSEGIYSNLEMYKTSDLPVFASANATENIFQYNDNNASIYVYFGYQNGNVWRYDGPNGGPSASMSYYLLSNNVGWKSGDENTIGVAVPKWAGNSNVKMLLQSNAAQLGSGIHTLFEY